jgi:ankyrin repeat protein
MSLRLFIHTFLFKQYGLTALYAAAQNGFIVPVKLLLQAGAKFDVKANVSYRHLEPLRAPLPLTFSSYELYP